MFSFSHVYPTSLYNGEKKPRNVRTRILGVVHPDKILYLVMSSNHTEILLVDQNGKSTTVLAFNRYIEIICADISFDFELLIYTERIPNGTRFSFKSVMYHLHSFSDIKAFEDNSPITSFFLPDINDNLSQSNSDKREYYFINIIGNRIAHFRATFANKKLQIKQERVGVNLSNCRCFFYNSNSKNNRLVCAITRNNTAYFFSFGKNKYFYQTSNKLNSYENINFCKYDIINLMKSNKNSGFNFLNFSKDKKNDNIIPSTVSPEDAIKLMNMYTTLPPELALLPSVPNNYPFFRFSSGNMHVIRLIPLSSSPNSNSSPLSASDSIEALSASSSSTSSSFCKDFAVIEQLYRGEEFPLAFTVTIVEQNYSRLIEVPNVQPDVPINFLSYENIVFVFVLNSFVSMIDFTTFPPLIFFLPRSLCSGPKIDSDSNSKSTGSCDISTTTGNFTVDLESGEVYHIGISMKEIPDNLNLNFSDKKILKIFATLVCRLPMHVSFSTVLSKLPLNEINTLIYFFRVLFQIGLAMDLNSKSASKSNSVNHTRTAQPGSYTKANLMPKPFKPQSAPYNADSPNLSSSSSASGGSIALNSIDDMSLLKNTLSRTQSQGKNHPVSVPPRNYQHRSRIKHYGRTVHDLNNVRPPLPKEYIMMLEEMSREFPSLGKYTRVDSFLYLLYQFRSLSIRERDAPDVALRHLLLQNRLSYLIRASIDEWRKNYNPSQLETFILNTAALSEAKKSSAPAISCLVLEVEAASDSICPLTIRNHLRCLALLTGISRKRNDLQADKRLKKRKKSTNVAVTFQSITNSTGSIERPNLSSPMVKRKSLATFSATNSNKPIRGKRNSLFSFPASIQSKTIQIKKVNSSSNFFRNLRVILSKNKDKVNDNIENVLTPSVLYANIRNREELELNYWASRIAPELNDVFKIESDSSIVLSKLTGSKWSHVDTTYGSDGIPIE